MEVWKGNLACTCNNRHMEELAWVKCEGCQQASVSDDDGSARHCEPSPLCGGEGLPYIRVFKGRIRICLSVCPPYLLCVGDRYVCTCVYVHMGACMCACVSHCEMDWTEWILIWTSVTWQELRLVNLDEDICISILKHIQNSNKKGLSQRDTYLVIAEIVSYWLPIFPV